jgi:acyl carrier protein
MESAILEIVSRVTGTPASEITPASSPDTIPTWDSVNHMQMMLELEQAFAITIPPEMIIELLSVQALFDAVRSLKQG